MGSISRAKHWPADLDLRTRGGIDIGIPSGQKQTHAGPILSHNAVMSRRFRRIQSCRCSLEYLATHLIVRYNEREVKLLLIEFHGKGGLILYFRSESSVKKYNVRWGLQNPALTGG